MSFVIVVVGVGIIFISALTGLVNSGNPLLEAHNLGIHINWVACFIFIPFIGASIARFCGCCVCVRLIVC